MPVDDAGRVVGQKLLWRGIAMPEKENSRGCDLASLKIGTADVSEGYLLEISRLGLAASRL